MKTLNIVALGAMLLLSGTLGAAEDQKTGDVIHLYMPDGQLMSHPVRVYIDRDIDDTMMPKLQLIGNQAVGDHDQEKSNGKRIEPVEDIAPMMLAQHQVWMQTEYGQDSRHVGTLMLFDLSKLVAPIGFSPKVSHLHWYQPTKRYTPILHWQGEKNTQRGIGDVEVYVVNRIGILIWTVLLVLILAGYIAWWSYKVKNSAWEILCADDGRLSLWRVQTAGWTIAVGGLVCAYGLTRLEVPVIPNSLMALMGMALGTAGASHYATRNQGVISHRSGHAMADLICNDQHELSLSRAQMVFWTVLVLTLFVTKSTMNGALWEVPWAMVALMGMSQSGYLVPKWYEKTSQKTKQAEISNE